MHLISSNKAMMIDIQVGQGAVECVTCPCWEAVTISCEVRLTLQREPSYSLYCSELPSISIVSVITRL